MIDTTFINLLRRIQLRTRDTAGGSTRLSTNVSSHSASSLIEGLARRKVCMGKTEYRRHPDGAYSGRRSSDAREKRTERSSGWFHHRTFCHALIKVRPNVDNSSDSRHGKCRKIACIEIGICSGQVIEITSSESCRTRSKLEAGDNMPSI